MNFPISYYDIRKIPPRKARELAAGYEQGKQLAYEFIEKYRDRFPSLVKALKEDLDVLLNHLWLPFRRRKSEKSFMMK